MRYRLGLCVVLAVAPLAAQPAINNQIMWDQTTLVLVQSGGGYGRMVRLPNQEILCSYTRGPSAYVRRSRDEGRTWQLETKVADFTFGNVANPELLVLQNGWILLSYNERPTDGIHPYTIRIGFSKDNGNTWGGYQLVYQAGTVPESGCWEPTQVQIPSGEIQLFFSNEKPYPTTNEQEITLVRSFDNGANWSAPQTVSYRAGSRDGMPVPLILAGQTGIVLSIEDNGLSGTFKPAIIYTSLADNWTQLYADGNSTRRWAALQTPLPSAVYAGAPYIRQFPTGETVLSVQSGEGRASPGTLDYSQMVVYIGDASARNFTNKSVPFSVPPTSNGLWNSLFIKNATTVTAISQITTNGVQGLWAIDGVLLPEGGPHVNTGGAVNAASYSPVGLANSAIAQGSIFNVFGKNLGPATIQYTGFPLSTTLAGTSAKVTVNGTTVAPLVIYTLATQLAMVMPSSTPAGAGTITVTYNGTTSAPVAVQVVATNFGIFTVNQAGSGPAVVTDANNGYNSLIHAARPGQTLVLWGTGLGKISADETQPPPQGNIGPKPTVWVGSQQANVVYWGRSGCCGGLDQINFQVPAGITGCYVSVAVQTGSTVSNFGSIAVSGSGSVCSDPAGLSSTQLTVLQNGQNLSIGTLDLSRSTVSSNPPPPLPPNNTTSDSASASFFRYTPTQLTSSNFGQAASVGGCMVFTINGTATVIDPIQPLGLDAGTSVTVSGPNGSKTLPLLVQSSKGSYGAALGSSTSPPLYLGQGTYTFNVPGGADVGAFTQQLSMPPSLTWTNQSGITSVSESQGVTVNWTNAIPNGYVGVTGYSFALDQNNNFTAGAVFTCRADAGSNGTGSFFVPPPVLLSLPVSSTSGGSGPAIPSGYLGISSETAAQSCTAPHIDVCTALASVLVEKTVTYTQ